MNKSLCVFTILLALNATASAQETVEAVQTSGVGELRRASELMVAPGSRNVSIRLPTTVGKGEVIYIQYEISGNMMSDSFMVTGITVSGKSCAIESKHNTALGAELSDMIFAQPCKKLR
jgi:hypothetical protein